MKHVLYHGVVHHRGFIKDPLPFPPKRDLKIRFAGIKASSSLGARRCIFQLCFCNSQRVHLLKLQVVKIFFEYHSSVCETFPLLALNIAETFSVVGVGLDNMPIKEVVLMRVASAARLGPCLALAIEFDITCPPVNASPVGGRHRN